MAPRIKSFLSPVSVLAALLAIGGATPVDAADRGCEAVKYKNADYVVCRFDPAAHDIRLFLNNADGEPYGHFNWVKEALAERGETLLFAMNAGMYHEDRSPVGFYREAGEDMAPVNTNDGPGNFHLKPNGVFYVLENGAAGVDETGVYLMTKRKPPHYATQSGPMLVIDGAIHPRFLPDSDSVKRRNGVGVTEEGGVFFVLADTPVRFYDFASYFRDVLKTPNALYLDGSISRLYAPELDRNDPGAAMGPIMGIVTRKNEASPD
ncbi:phosphodiester glycosidase family protein [Marinicaulis aureus]|uniref:Phosphodiester glycosidase family protein n=1 Tax=Hyphococcus aureus TaxID=2666033 RepID=A0ABW1KR41_9PROT